jgi:hypothetical protein
VVDNVEDSKTRTFHISNDFFGLLNSLEVNQKKTLVLDDYKLIFRFSIGKLMNYISENTFIIILLQYLK